MLLLNLKGNLKSLKHQAFALFERNVGTQQAIPHESTIRSICDISLFFMFYVKHFGKDNSVAMTR